MTDSQRGADSSAGAVTEYIGDRTNPRKLRLFTCACLWRVYHLTDPSYPDNRAPFEFLQRHADGEVGDEALAAEKQRWRAVRDAKMEEYQSRSRADPAYRPPPDESIYGLAQFASFPDPGLSCQETLSVIYKLMSTQLVTVQSGTRTRRISRAGDERAAQAVLSRDIFGDEHRPVRFDSRWRSSSALGLARTMYESRDFAPMPILTDALEEAGCDSADVLAHCRGPGPHVRGCWVVDLVLGKA